MLTMTPTAAEHLSGILQTHTEELAARLVFSDTGWQVRLDREQTGDVTFEHDGRTVLLVQEPLIEALADAVMDLRVEDGRPKLLLH